jgi:hypothetical protein
VKRIEKS